MNQALLNKIEAASLRKNPLQFNVGDSVRVHTKVIEGDKERIQVFSGVVIGRRGHGINETFTVRRISFGEGVERVFPVHSPRIEKIEVERRGQGRQPLAGELRLEPCAGVEAGQVRIAYFADSNLLSFEQADRVGRAVERLVVQAIESAVGRRPGVELDIVGLCRQCTAEGRERVFGSVARIAAMGDDGDAASASGGRIVGAGGTHQSTSERNRNKDRSHAYSRARGMSLEVNAVSAVAIAVPPGGVKRQVVAHEAECGVTDERRLQHAHAIDGIAACSFPGRRTRNAGCGIEQSDDARHGRPFPCGRLSYRAAAGMFAESAMAR